MHEKRRAKRTTLNLSDLYFCPNRKCDSNHFPRAGAVCKVYTNRSSFNLHTCTGQPKHNKYRKVSLKHVTSLGCELQCDDPDNKELSEKYQEQKAHFKSWSGQYLLKVPADLPHEVIQPADTEVCVRLCVAQVHR